MVKFSCNVRYDFGFKMTFNIKRNVIIRSKYISTYCLLIGQDSL